MEQRLEVKKTYRYYTHGDPLQATTIIYVLHGYGQLAEYFLNKFKTLDSTYFIVAPEGMHRFYLKGSSGRVGASWMTKEGREYDIADTMNWLNILDDTIQKKYQFTKKIILGFSQGGATAARWNQFGTYKANHIIYWASVFPPDLEEKFPLELNENLKNYFVLGDQDEYFTQEEQERSFRSYSNKGFNTIKYIGNHSINSEIFANILKRL
jgi:predicted esterase